MCVQGIPAGGVTKPSVTTVPGTQGVLPCSWLQAQSTVYIQTVMSLALSTAYEALAVCRASSNLCLVTETPQSPTAFKHTKLEHQFYHIAQRCSCQTQEWFQIKILKVILQASLILLFTYYMFYILRVFVATLCQAVASFHLVNPFSWLQCLYNSSPKNFSSDGAICNPFHICMRCSLGFSFLHVMLLLPLSGLGSFISSIVYRQQVLIFFSFCLKIVRIFLALCPLLESPQCVLMLETRGHLTLHP